MFDGKDHFTIIDFVKAHHLFSDPAWDGEPVAPEPAHASPRAPPRYPPADPTDPPAMGEGEQPAPVRLKVKLVDGKARAIQHMSATRYWSADGTPMSAAQFLEALCGALPSFFHDEDELRRLWSHPDTRRQLLEGLAEQGFGSEQLTAMQRLLDAANSDLDDVLAYVAFASAPVTRAERAMAARNASAVDLTDRQQAFVDFVLAQDVAQGVGELDTQKRVPLLKLRYRAPGDAFAQLGPPEVVRRVSDGFRPNLDRPPSGPSAP